MKFSKLNAYQIELLRNKDLTVEDLQKELNCSGITIYRWRKKLNSSPGRGSKKGKARPWQLKRSLKVCECCSIEYEVIGFNSTRRFCSLSCATKSIDKSYMQTEEYKNTLRNPDLPEFEKYSRKVHFLTRKLYEEYSHVINPNGYKRGLAGEDNAYHLDHIIPIKYGFENSIPPEELAKIDNLQMLPWKTNISKSAKYEEN